MCRGCKSAGFSGYATPRNRGCRSCGKRHITFLGGKFRVVYYKVHLPGRLHLNNITLLYLTCSKFQPCSIIGYSNDSLQSSLRDMRDVDYSSNLRCIERYDVSRFVLMVFGSSICDAISSQCGRLGTCGNMTLCINGHRSIGTCSYTTIWMCVVVCVFINTIEFCFIRSTHKTSN